MRILGAGLVAGLGLYAVVFGLLYATRIEMMPHHDAVVPDDIQETVLPLYHALMRLAGAGATALGIVCVYLALGPMRAGNRVAAAVASLCLSAFYGATAIAAMRLEAISGVATHGYVMAVLSVLALVGLALHLWLAPSRKA